MEFKSRYKSKAPDSSGFVAYSEQENQTWKTLYTRQEKLLSNRACKEHIEGLQLLGMQQDKIPQLTDINERMDKLTGWQVVPVEALISHKAFFTLLSEKKFPAATFIRVPEELDYIKEPDIFHEYFGHCPMLTQPVFADFVQAFAKKVLTFAEMDWPLLQRLFWFTVEFGLIHTVDGLRIYGGGILSSIGEIVYAVESDIPQRQWFNLLVLLRTPYRIDHMQPIYFVVDSYETLFNCMDENIQQVIAKARELGEFPALFDADKDDPNAHIMAC